MALGVSIGIAPAATALEGKIESAPPLVESEAHYREYGTYAPESGHETPTNILTNKCGEHEFSQDVLTPQDVLVLGDSQLWTAEDSWVGSGITQAGYRVKGRICAHGGIGFINNNDGKNESYYEGVVGGRWRLPTGNPAAVFIVGSGNDAKYDHNTVTERAKRTIQELKKRYPGSQIILSDPISAEPSKTSGAIADGNNSHRIILGKKLMELAKEQKIPFISVRYWASDYGVSQKYSTYYQDSRHFKRSGHAAIAPHFARSFRQAMQGYTTYGAIGDYAASRGGTSRFGEPVTHEVAAGPAGVSQTFSKSHTVYWSPQTGASSVNSTSLIGSYFHNEGKAEWFGYPLFDEANIPSGSMQKFSLPGRGVTALYQHQGSTNVHSVEEYNGIGSKFTVEGGTGTFGFPVEQETAYAYGARQSFTLNGLTHRIYWSPQTDSHVMKEYGAIFARWVNMGHAYSLGFPVTDEIREEGSVVQYFRDRQGRETGIWWHPQHGTHAMNSKGAIYWHWRHAGGYRALGYPVSSEQAHADGSVTVKFSSGTTLRWTETGGVTQER